MGNQQRTVIKNVSKARENLDKEALMEKLDAQVFENGRLIESLTNVQAMLAREDNGWLKLNGWEDSDDLGMSLEDLKGWSSQIQDALAGTPLLKSGAKFRSSYIWDGGIRYSGIPKETRGAGAKVQKAIDNPLNQARFFGQQAREEREECLFTDGFVLYVGDDTTKEIRPIPLKEITGLYKNPEFQDEVWAYRREWANSNDPNQPKNVEWIYTDTFIDKKTQNIAVAENKVEPVAQNKTAFDGVVNSHIGWALGVPDALAALVWWRQVKEGYLDGLGMTKAMSTIAYKATVATKTAGDNVSVKFASGNAAGSTAALGSGNDLVPMSTAGRGYDFSTLRPIAALVAASLEISVVALLRDPGAAGSSYGSAQTLDEPTKKAIATRRQWHIDLDKRVLAWLGAKGAVVEFKSDEDSTSLYRRLQATVLGWTTGAMHPEEVRNAILDILDLVTDKTAVPSGILLPNNSATASLARKDLDTDASGGNNSTTSSSPGQGQQNPAGNSPAGNDTRTDVLSNSARREMLEAIKVLEAMLAPEAE